MAKKKVDLGWAWKPDSKTRSAINGWCSDQQRKRQRRKKRRANKRKGLRKLLYAPGQIFYESKPWKAMRRRVFATYERRCMKCDVIGGELHVDHIMPRSMYPELSLTFENLQVLCRDCNMAKWNYHATDYREESVARALDREAVREAASRL